MRDLKSALKNLTEATHQLDTKWKVSGPDVDNEVLEVVVVLTTDVLVVTLF